LSIAYYIPKEPVIVVPGFSIHLHTTPVTIKDIAIGNRYMLRKNFSNLTFLSKRIAKRRPISDRSYEKQGK
jgi:hypothetical protein